jgi:hypothetical protein
MLGPEPSYEVTLDFPLPERQRLALYLVRHLGGANVAFRMSLRYMTQITHLSR